jgi:hypothetical protein
MVFHTPVGRAYTPGIAAADEFFVALGISVTFVLAIFGIITLVSILV